ncbi:hypothetical protein CCS01_18085 [Rhodopila globiformis]|uniref:Uncharacterized protein n=2 Tax=Rhodopila globiformis TaxID=1071 RepID=A0A2S6N8X4_RHOGL|nr:hypothetical protein CCS01_18085 [Rhodopila globiformis]
MKLVNVHAAQTTLSQLLADVENGEDVVITRYGVPIARLTPLAKKPIGREPGVLRAHPAWRAFAYDPKVFTPMTGEEPEAEGWM